MLHSFSLGSSGTKITTNFFLLFCCMGYVKLFPAANDNEADLEKLC